MRREIEMLIEKEEFRAKVEKATTVEEVIGIFKENGVDVTEEELRQNGSTELSVDELENVAGGVWHDYINPGYWIGRLVKKLIYDGNDACGI